MTTRDLTAVALFAAITAVCAQVSVAVPDPLGSRAFGFVTEPLVLATRTG